MNRIMVFFAFIAFLPCATTSAQGLQKLDPKVAEAWQRAGARVEWFGRTRDGGWQLTAGKPQDENAIASIYWSYNLAPPRLDKLPVPDVPFALFLGSALGQPLLTDAGMKEIARFKTLRFLQISGTAVTDAGLQELVKLDDGLWGLSLGHLPISDAGLKIVARLPCLEYLMLGNNPRVTDAGIKELARLKKLKTLGLHGLAVTDATLEELTALENLESLFLGSTAVTDAGLKELARLKKLRHVSLRGTKVTEAGVKQLQKALPKLEVLR